VINHGDREPSIKIPVRKDTAMYVEYKTYLINKNHQFVGDNKFNKYTTVNYIEHLRIMMNFM
jgi:hypothetical protein